MKPWGLLWCCREEQKEKEKGAVVPPPVTIAKRAGTNPARHQCRVSAASVRIHRRDDAAAQAHVAVVEHGRLAGRDGPLRLRSEEHTSELQSRLHLVCRLLLEKKKQHEPAAPPRPYHRPQS